MDRDYPPPMGYGRVIPQSPNRWVGMSTSKRLLVRVMLLSLLALATAGPALAAPGWNPPVEGQEKTSHSPEYPRVGVGSSGATVTAWSRFDPGAGVRVFETRIAPAAGPLGPAVRLSTPGVGVGGFDLAVADDGRAVAVWRESGQMMAAVRPPGGAFGPRQALSKPAGESAGAVDVEVDGAGNATVLWTTSQGTAWRTRTTVIAAGAVNGPTTLIHLEPAAQLVDPALAVDATGRAHGVWIRSQVTGPNRTTTVQRAYRPAGGGFAYAGDLDAKTEAPYNNEIQAGLQAPRVAVDGQGAAVAIWFRPGAPNAIRWSAGPAAGAFAPAATLGGDPPLGGARLAMSAAGEALIAGATFTAPHAAWVARRAPGGSFGAPETFAATDVQGVFDLAMGPAGETVVTWLTHAGAYQAHAAYRPDAGAPWIPTALGPPTASLYSGTLIADAAVDRRGDAAVAWSAGPNGAFHTVQARYEAPRAGGPGGTGGDATDTKPPLVRGLRMTPRVFAVAGRKRAASGAARGRRAKRGSTLRFRLSERARVHVRIDRVQRGRRAGGRCRPAAQAGRRCVRLRRVGTLIRRGRPAGANRIRFSGRVAKRRALRPGRYRATVRAIDAAGNRSLPRRVAFRIVRGR